MHQKRRAASLAALLIVAAAGTVNATWSIVVVDTATKEVGIASATCLPGFNLQTGLPVVIPSVGAAAAQSLVDQGAVNRMRIWDRLLSGVDPQLIVWFLAANDSSHENRQYGIVDVQGRAITFTGSLAGAFADGLTGQSGSLVYAIQGNVITGLPVLLEAEAALVDTPGDMAGRLMAAMEAAAAMGGDGRCSCMPGNPVKCGSPPADFDKSADVGFLIVARKDDRRRGCRSNSGCANGDYYLAINIIGIRPDPDPTIPMRAEFDAWRATLAGRTDAVRSSALLDRTALQNDGVATATLRIELRDWQGAAIGAPVTVEVLDDPDEGSRAVTQIGAVQPVDVANGIYEAVITAGVFPGRDFYRVVVTGADGVAVTLMPSPTLKVLDLAADLDGDEDVDGDDLLLLLSAFAQGTGGDVDGDGDTDIDDLLRLLLAYET